MIMLSNGSGFLSSAYSFFFTRCFPVLSFLFNFFSLQLLMVPLQFPSFEMEETFHANVCGFLSSAHSFFFTRCFLVLSFLLTQLLMVSLQFPSFEIEEPFHANGCGSLSSAHSFFLHHKNFVLTL